MCTFSPSHSAAVFSWCAAPGLWWCTHHSLSFMRLCKLMALPLSPVVTRPEHWLGQTDLLCGSFTFLSERSPSWSDTYFRSQGRALSVTLDVCLWQTESMSWGPLFSTPDPYPQSSSVLCLSGPSFDWHSLKITLLYSCEDAFSKQLKILQLLWELAFPRGVLKEKTLQTSVGAMGGGS